MQPPVNGTLSLHFVIMALTLGGAASAPGPGLHRAYFGLTRRSPSPGPSGSTHQSLRPFSTLLWGPGALELPAQTALGPPPQSLHGLLGGHPTPPRGGPETVVCGWECGWSLDAQAGVSTHVCEAPHSDGRIWSVKKSRPPWVRDLHWHLASYWYYLPK